MDVFSKEYAKSLDQQDELAHFREEFYLKEGRTYLDGNSLGLLSKRAERAVLNLLHSWKEYGIDGWTQGEHPWFYLSESLSEKIITLTGSDAEEVIITGSTTSNLHQLVASFYQPEGKRTKILADELTFPTDIYAMKSQLQLRGYDPAKHLVLVKSEDGRLLKEEDIIAAMTEEIALIILPGVLYRSGQVLDMEQLTNAAHERGILIGFDLCHSIGSIPHELSRWGVDFAFWCNYKHVNGGPGSTAALYVNKKHFGQAPGLAGWFGSKKETQFDMTLDLDPAEHAGAYQMGTPHVLSTAPLLGALELFNEAGIDRIRNKSLQLTNYMMELIEHELAEFHFTIANPRNDRQRGGHLFLEHIEAARICKALKAHEVIPDFRAPNGIRLAPVALYNTFEDVWQTVKILKEIMEKEQYKQYKNERDVVA
ncbi:kynureninase [Bacillus sp. Hm123]|uniref:kynureninase n=1 Tax=Bacillus sp. Hm123 TaxID=3450745 RepID=UPI003F4358EC